MKKERKKNKKEKKIALRRPFFFSFSFSFCGTCGSRQVPAPTNKKCTQKNSPLFIGNLFLFLFIQYAVAWLMCGWKSCSRRIGEWPASSNAQHLAWNVK